MTSTETRLLKYLTSFCSYFIILGCSQSVDYQDKYLKKYSAEYYSNYINDVALAHANQHLSQDLSISSTSQAIFNRPVFDSENPSVANNLSNVKADIFPKHLPDNSTLGELIQHDLACKQPILTRYYNNKSKLSETFKLPSCDSDIPFYVTSSLNGSRTVWLDPARVSNIHVLFAGKGQNLASRFGHIALRLVVCPPSQTNSPAACDKNLPEHLVLGFRAHIDDLSLNMLKALGGQYSAYLFASNFIDVYEDYAINEFRDIYSLPLLLTSAERLQLVRELSELHWRYSDTYSFFSNNCSTLLQDALRIVWPKFAENDIASTSYLRPDLFFEALKGSSLADGEKLNSLRAAEREGYFFSSTRPYYERAAREVRTAMKNPFFSDIDSYLDMHPIKRRQHQELDREFMDKLGSNEHLREAQIMLEEYAVLHSERMLISSVANFLVNEDFIAKPERLLNQLDTDHAKTLEECVLIPIRQHAQPIRRQEGIPSKHDEVDLTKETLQCDMTEKQKLLREAMTQLGNNAPDLWRAINSIFEYQAESIKNVNILADLDTL